MAVQTFKGSTAKSLAEKVSTKDKEEILEFLKRAEAPGKSEGRDVVANATQKFRVSRAA